MKALLTITQRDIGGKTVDTIDAREFYNLFQRAQQFSNWLGSCIQRFQFVPDVDYICIDTRPVGTKHGPTQRNYYMNLSAMKILAKSMRTQLGNEIYHWLEDYAQQQILAIQPVAQPVNGNLPLVLGDITVHQDEQGRYCLNDLHKAAGGDDKFKPAFWLRNEQTNQLISELQKCNSTDNQPVKVVRGGSKQGTYATKELVYAYAMWISPAFNLKVIRTFDNVVMQQITQSPMQQPQVPAISNYDYEQAIYERDALQGELAICRVRERNFQNSSRRELESERAVSKRHEIKAKMYDELALAVSLPLHEVAVKLGIKDVDTLLRKFWNIDWFDKDTSSFRTHIFNISQQAMDNGLLISRSIQAKPRGVISKQILVTPHGLRELAKVLDRENQLYGGGFIDIHNDPLGLES